MGQATYGLLVVPGLELTFNTPTRPRPRTGRPRGSKLVSVDKGITEAIQTAVEAGAAVIAAHA